MIPQTYPLTQSSVFANWPLAASYGESMACWDPTEAEEATPAMEAAGAIALAELEIPVWRLSEADAPAAGKFVRYCDMPAVMAADFREQQVLAGKPFAGAAYVEDFQLFIDLGQRRR